MNMFARFNENPAKTLQDIKETKRYRRTDPRTDTWTDNVKTVYPLQTKFAGGIITVYKNICYGSVNEKLLLRTQKHMFDREIFDNNHFWGLYIFDVYLSISPASLRCGP